jgi:hypothetical protein
MGDLPESFPVSMQVRTKHAEKTRVGLWGQSTMLKAVWDVVTFKGKKIFVFSLRILLINV